MLAAEPSFTLNGLNVTSMMQVRKKDGKTIHSSTVKLACKASIFSPHQPRCAKCDLIAEFTQTNVVNIKDIPNSIRMNQVV